MDETVKNLILERIGDGIKKSEILNFLLEILNEQYDNTISSHEFSFFMKEYTEKKGKNLYLSELGIEKLNKNKYKYNNHTKLEYNNSKRKLIRYIYSTFTLNDFKNLINGIEQYDDFKNFISIKSKNEYRIKYKQKWIIADINKIFEIFQDIIKDNINNANDDIIITMNNLINVKIININVNNLSNNKLNKFIYINNKIIFIN